MNKKIIIVYILSLLLGCSRTPSISLPSPPEGWKLISADKDKNISYLEKSISSRKNKYGHFVDFWILENKVLNTEKKPTESSSKVQIRIECNNKQIMTLRTVEYNRFNGLGDVYSDTGENYLTSLKGIVPQSIGEDMHEIMCKEYKFIPIEK